MNRMTILPWLVWAAIVATMISAVTKCAHAEPMAEARRSRARVVLFSEPCALTAVSNLPKRATWEEGGRIFEGCWGGAEGLDFVLAYFEDLTVVAIPVLGFRPLRNS